jgi:hypothetical protein
VLIWKDGKLSPCNKSVDKMIMGVVQKNREEPIIMGAEPVLVAGKIKEGDYVVTSKIRGCARKLY